MTAKFGVWVIFMKAEYSVAVCEVINIDRSDVVYTSIPYFVPDNDETPVDPGSLKDIGETPLP